MLERRLLATTIESINAVERPEPTKDEPQHMPLDKAYDNPTGEGAATASRIHPAHPLDRRGKEGLRPIAGPQAAAMGGRADVRMAVEVPRDPGAVREEGHQLPRADSAGLRTVLVSQAPPHGSM